MHPVGIGQGPPGDRTGSLDVEGHVPMQRRPFTKPKGSLEADETTDPGVTGKKELRFLGGLGSEPRRSRTFNKRIKSPLLYQLSYGP